MDVQNVSVNSIKNSLPRVLIIVFAIFLSRNKCDFLLSFINNLLLLKRNICIVLLVVVEFHIIYPSPVSSIFFLHKNLYSCYISFYKKIVVDGKTRWTILWKYQVLPLLFVQRICAKSCWAAMILFKLTCSEQFKCREIKVKICTWHFASLFSGFVKFYYMVFYFYIFPWDWVERFKIKNILRKEQWLRPCPCYCFMSISIFKKDDA